MELKGKIITVLPERSGTSARGAWKSQDFVIETQDEYHRKMCFTVFGEDKLSRFQIMTGDEGIVYFDVSAKEYNGKWYNSINAIDFRKTALAGF